MGFLAPSPRRLAALALLAWLPACGGGGDAGPAAPSVAAPRLSWVTTSAIANVTYAFTWEVQPEATSYLFEIGTTFGGNEVLSREFTTPGHTISLPAGPGIAEYYLRLRSRGPFGESAINSTFAHALDLRTVIEALFFESGPRHAFGFPRTDVLDWSTAGFTAFKAADEMLAWAPGSRVNVIASDTLRDDQLQAARETVDQFNAAAGGVVRAILTTTADPDPPQRPGVITLAHGDPSAECSANAVGCASRTIEGGVITQARLVITRNSTGCVTAHELGHGLFGFGHITLQDVQGVVNATMSPGGCAVPRLTQPELDALEESYSRGMRAGANRQDFVRAGLVVP
jgi:hypothetical protein